MGLTDKNLFAYCDNNPVIRADHGGDFWHIVAGAVIGGVGSFVSTLITGGSVEDALISAAFGAVSGALTAAFPAFGALIGASFGAAESAVIDVKNMKEKNLTVTDIVVNATISAAFGALSGAGDDYFSSKSFVDDVVDVRKAVKGTTKGNHPVVKRHAKDTISSFRKKCFKEAKLAAMGFGVTTAMSYGAKEYVMARFR